MSRSLYMQRRLLKRRRERLAVVAVLLELLDEDEADALRGRMYGSQNIRRTRKSLDAMWKELGCDARKAWRMSIDSFNKLHELLLPKLKEEFPGRLPGTRGRSPNGDIPTKLRLSAAIRFFSGGSVLDIILTHGMSKQVRHVI